MVFLYLALIFVICLSTYAVYYAKTAKSKETETLHIKEDNDDLKKILNKLSLIKVDSIEEFKGYMREPTENINTMLSLLKALKEHYDKMDTPLNELSKLKSQLETFSNSISRLENQQLSTLITNMEQELHGLKVTMTNENVSNKITELGRNIDLLKSLISTLALPESEILALKGAITDFEKSLGNTSADVKKVIEILKNIENLNISKEVTQIHTSLKSLPGILKTSTEIKEMVDKLKPTLETVKLCSPKIADIESKINSYWLELSKALGSVDGVVKTLKDVKDLIEKIPLDQINKISEVAKTSATINTNLQAVKTDMLEMNEFVNRVHLGLGEIKTKIENIDFNSLQKMKASISELKGAFVRVIDVLKPGARNLLRDSTLVFKDDKNQDYTVHVKIAAYRPEELEGEIRNSLIKDKDKFKLQKVNDRVEVEYSQVFHMDNNIRELLGFPRVDTPIFLKKYRAPNPDNLNHIILETLVHKHSVDAIARKMKSAVHDQINIVNKIPKDLQTITAKLDKNIIPKVILDGADHVKNNYVRSDLIGLIDFLFTMHGLNEEFKKYLEITDSKDYTIINLIDLLEKKFYKNIDKIAQKVRIGVVETLLDKQTFLSQYNLLVTAIQSQFDSFERKFDAAVVKLQTRAM